MLFLFIEIDRIFDKIESELQEARRAASEEEMRAKLYTVKSLCELVLGESAPKDAAKEVRTEPSAVAGGAVSEKKPAKENPAAENDLAGANGESIFDF